MIKKKSAPPGCTFVCSPLMISLTTAAIAARSGPAHVLGAGCVTSD